MTTSSSRELRLPSAAENIWPGFWFVALYFNFFSKRGNLNGKCVQQTDYACDSAHVIVSPHHLYSNQTEIELKRERRMFHIKRKPLAFFAVAAVTRNKTKSCAF